MFSFRGRAMRLPSSGTSALARQYKHLLAMSPISMQYNSFPTVRLLEPGPMMLHAVCSTSGLIASLTPTPYVPTRCFRRACFYFLVFFERRIWIYALCPSFCPGAVSNIVRLSFLTSRWEPYVGTAKHWLFTIIKATGVTSRLNWLSNTQPLLSLSIFFAILKKNQANINHLTERSNSLRHHVSRILCVRTTTVCRLWRFWVQG